MATKSDQAQFVEELEQDGASFFSAGVLNNITDIVLTVSIVLASLVAACLAVAHLDARWLIALIAGVPAAAASIQAKVGTRERSEWYFLYAAEVRALAVELKYAAQPNMHEFGARRGKLEVMMEGEWKRAGRHVPTLANHKGKSTHDE